MVVDWLFQPTCALAGSTTTSNVILTVDNEVCILARFQMVPGGLVANGVRGPRSWQGFSVGVVSSGEAPVATVQPVVLALTQFSVLRL